MNINKIKATIGETYFDIQEEQNYFSVCTRKNGDTADGIAAPYDIAQAKDIITKLKAAGIGCRLSVVDEWVEVEISKSTNA